MVKRELYGSLLLEEKQFVLDSRVNLCWIADVEKLELLDWDEMIDAKAEAISRSSVQI